MSELEPIEQVIERAEREAEAEARLAPMSACERADAHIYSWGTPTCLYGEMMVNGDPVRPS